MRSRFRTEGVGGGGGAGIISPPPRNLEIEYGYYISYLQVTEHIKYVSSKCCLEVCPRLRQKQSDRMQIQNFPKGACPHPPLVGMHTFHTLLSSCYHPVSPSQLKILYETLGVHKMLNRTRKRV